MTKQDRLMSKIQTMLDIAERETTTPGEAAAAMSRAQELMLKHDLAESKVRAFELTPSQVAIERRQIHLGWGLYKDWKQQVIFGTAKHFMLRGLSSGVFYGMVLGRRKDINVYVTALESIFRQIDAQAAIALKTRTPEEKAMVHGKSFKRSFYRGAARGFIARMHEDRRRKELRATDTAVHQTAIVPVIDGAIKKYIQDMWGGLSGTYRSNESRSGLQTAYYKGYDAGRQTSATPALGTGE